MTTAFCSREGCQSPRYSKGFCRFHYERQRKGIPLDLPRKKWNRGGTRCTHSNCTQQAKVHDLCELHYKRSKAGLPMDMPLRQGARWLCSYDGCNENCGRSGLCPTHWHRVWMRTHGATRRASKSAAFVENVDVEVLRERDGGVCGLCDTSVDPSLQWPDPMSQSIDHVTPLSRGGDHSYRNTQLAHLSCNARKGNRVDA